MPPLLQDIRQHVQLGSLGVNAINLFKPGGQYRLITLEQYVVACYEVYRESPGEVPSIPAFIAPIERAIATLADFC